MTEERDLIEAAKRLQRHAEDRLDELTIARLRAVRSRALDAAPQPRFAWLATGGLVSAGLALAIAGLVWLQVPADIPDAGDAAVVADVDILTTPESPEFYSELEFYDWLASEADAG